MAWIFKRPESAHWWIGYRINGRQYRRSTGTADETKAKQEMARLELIHGAHKAGSLTEEFYRLLTRNQAPAVTLVKALDDWLADCRELGESTVQRYRDVQKALVEHLGATEQKPLLIDVTRPALAAFLRDKRKTSSTATVRLYRRVLTNFFQFAVDNELLTANPVPSGKSLKLTTATGRAASASVRRAFTLDELKLIFSKAPNDFWRWMIMAGFYFGQRMGDLITLPWGAVDFERHQLHLRQSKTGKTVHAPMRPELEACLLARRKEVGAVKPSDPIWPEQAAKYEAQGSGPFSNEFYEDVLLPAGLVSKRTHKKAKDGGSRREVTPVSFHCLRHTFVSLLKLTGGSQAVAKELAGHSSDQVSDLYTHVPEEALSKAINALPEVCSSSRS